jgi:hypothetical protein
MVSCLWLEVNDLNHSSTKAIQEVGPKKYITDEYKDDEMI